MGSGGIRIACLLLACALWFSLGSGAFSSTTIGTQCPTAPVQLLTVPKKNCCGKIVGYESRAPKPGDKQFQQCRCAEKSSIQVKVTKPAPDLFLPPLIAEVVALPVAETPIVHSLWEQDCPANRPPPLLPPRA